MHSARYARRSFRRGYLYHYLPPFGKIAVHLFTTKQNKMASECIAVPNGNASGKFNLANDSVLFSVCLISRVKGDDIIKLVTWVNCYYLCSYRTLQFTYYRSLNYIFGVGHEVMEFCDSYAFLLL